MIAPTSISQPIAPIVQSQLAVDSLRVDNVQLPQVPEVAKLFASNNAKETNPRGSQTAAENSPPQSTPNNNPQLVNGTEDDSKNSKQDGQQNAEQDSSQSKQPSANQDPQEQQQIRQLSSRDREVKAHEQAHSSVGGQFTGAPSFVYEKGPNGVLYAVAGEVSISTSEVPGDPEASIAKLETVVRAALAPSDPSSQDLRVAASAVASAENLRALINKDASASEADSTDKNTTTNAEDETEQPLPPQQRLRNQLQSSGAFEDEASQPLIAVSV